MEEKTTKENYFLKIPAINFLTIIFALGVIFIRNSYLPEKIPFFYSRPWGEEQLALKNWIFILSGATLIIFFLSYQVSKILQKKEERLLANILNCGSFLFSILSAITILKIIFLIT